MSKTAHLLDLAHRSLHTGAHRLHRGHQALMETAAAYRLPTNPKSRQPEKPEKPAGPEDPDSEAEAGAEPETSGAKTDKETKKKAGKKASKRISAKGRKTSAKGQKASANEKEAEAEAEDERHPLRPGPRRATRAVGRWVTEGDGGWDTLLRLGVVLLAFLLVAYFTGPFIEETPLPVAVLLPVAVVLYDSSPRASLLLGTALAAFTLDQVWAALGVVLLVGAAFAPVLVALLVLALTASAIHPALMWPVVLLWGIATWRAGALPEEVEEEDVGDHHQEEAEEEAEEPAEIHPLVLLCAVLTGNEKGVHLNAVVKALRANGSTTIEKPGQLRPFLLAQGVAVKDSVRAPKWATPGGPKGTTSGVYREDLERVIGPLSDLLARTGRDPVATAVAAALTCDVASSATAVATS
ncbi:MULTISPECIES: hypothetical protein [unclassified Streptomyces]|uniref:hypothetical protein n=1 Tax=unclassified Streptomyces TaxID=2593676 RepID=UPI00093C6E61|nr:hypothetical protein [Streptomyces sp. TSRI0281]OKI34995.1 hypothetical protein A6A29_16350 [Streptomyces sp. TSRI0281]